MKYQNIKVVKNEEKPETPELLADSIVKISRGFAQLTTQGLTEEAIVILLKGMRGMTDVSTPAIRMTIQNLPKLASYYLKNIKK